MKSLDLKKITAYDLRIFAFTTMAINHFGTLLCRYFNAYGSFAYELQVFVSRSAFVVFCFFLAEGMYHTRSRLKYLSRILITALISEFFYDYALMRSVPNWNGQNVCFTLFLGGTIIYLNDFVKEKVSNLTLSFLFQILITLSLSYISSISNVDYGFMGIALILEFYYLRKQKLLMLICVAFSIPLLWGLQVAYYYSFNIGMQELIKHALSELPGVLILPVLYFYRGEQGKKMPTWLVYGFYPLHLALAGLIFKVIL